MSLSPFAQSVLAFYRAEPDQVQYAIDLLPSMFRPEEVVQLDEAYQELEGAGYLARSGAIIRFLGRPKPLYRLTPRGQAAEAVEVIR